MPSLHRLILAVVAIAAIVILVPVASYDVDNAVTAIVGLVAGFGLGKTAD